MCVGVCVCVCVCRDGGVCTGGGALAVWKLWNGGIACFSYVNVLILSLLNILCD